MSDVWRPEIASVEVLDRKGAAIALSSLWRERATLLLLIRHFG